ncbi:MAG: hypothetical protein CSA97_05030 [Bacteroidetes bacterium]|nr:MAG: hypothetical protein CSA97_05030 [Bacteroidota bacterium]
MEYNTQRSPLRLSEYGRNVQQMVDALPAIEDRKKRTEQAEAIVNVMLRLQPKIKELEDYQRKLWDHLHVMADYSLDVDSPYPVPKREEIEKEPERVPYGTHTQHSNHYGAIIMDMIATIAREPEGPEREQKVLACANQMKRAYLKWNKNSVDDELIARDLEQYSGGVLKLPEGVSLSATLPQSSEGKKQNAGNRQNNPNTRKRRTKRKR